MEGKIIKLDRGHWADYQIFIYNSKGEVAIDQQMKGTKRDAEQELKKLLTELETI